MKLVFLGAPRDEGATKMNVNKNDSALHCSWPFFSCTTEFTSWLSVFLPVFFFGLSRVTVIQLQILDESPEDRSAGKWFSRHAKNPY